MLGQSCPQPTALNLITLCQPVEARRRRASPGRRSITHITYYKQPVRVERNRFRKDGSVAFPPGRFIAVSKYLAGQNTYPATDLSSQLPLKPRGP
jgi:hypothetical protein